MIEYKWYRKYKKYKYGDYIKGKGYYNEDSGEWVSRLNKKNIDEKYIRYEFSIYDDREIENDFGYENIERVGKFLSTIYKRNLEIERRYDDRYCFIENVYVIGILGKKNHKLIIEKLNKELGLIDVKVGSSKGFKKAYLKYKLSGEFFDNRCFKRHVGIRNTRITRFLDRFYGVEISKNKYLNYEFGVCRRLGVLKNESILDELFDWRLNIEKKKQIERRDWDFYSKSKRIKYSREWNKKRDDEYLKRLKLNFEALEFDIKLLQNGVSNYKGFSESKTAGRVRNPILNYPKEFRRLLRIDGEELIEVDMKSAYPSLLFRIIRGIRDIDYGNSKFDDKIKDCVGDIDVGEFIEEYEDLFSGKSNLDFYEEVAKKTSINDVSISNYRGYIKELILILINAKTSDLKSKRYIKELFNYDELMDLIFTSGVKNVIEKIKEYEFNYSSKENYYGYYKYKNTSRVMMNLESMIMKGIWDKMIKKEIDYISLYDGMLIKKSKKKQVKEIIDGEVVGYNSCIRMDFKI